MTYDDFIENIKSSRGQWNIPEGSYWEGHHIIPKCLRGKGNSRQKHENIIWLYAKEHYIAHKLLLEKYPDNKSIILAFSMMAFPKGKTKRENMLTPEEYEEAKILFSKSISGKNNPMYGKVPYNKGVPMKEEQRLFLSSKLKGRGKGVHKSEETKRHMSESALKRDNFNNHSTLGKLAITNGIELKFIDNNESLPEGFYFGNCKTSGSHDMSKYKNDIEAQKRNSIAKSGKNNSMYGKGYKLAGGNNGKAIYNYYYKGLKFDCRLYLIQYLKSIGIDISENAVRNIQNNTYGIRIAKKFKDVIDNLSWELK